MTKVQHPYIQQQLVALDEEDQAEVRSHFQNRQNAATTASKERLDEELARHCHKRARTMLDLIRDVRPTIKNIGKDGSQAVVVLALHSYLEVMEKILDIYTSEHAKDPHNIYAAGIPPLMDRIMILKQRQQSFGTNWAQDKTGNFYLIPVLDFATMNERRQQYSLGPVKKPVILSHGAPSKRPLGEGLAELDDQRSMSDEAYTEYAKYHLTELK